MKNKIIFFSIDRLGDFLIRSNVINRISKNYKFKEIVCSEKNFKLIKKAEFHQKLELQDTMKTLLIPKIVYQKCLIMFHLRMKKQKNFLIMGDSYV